jgi:hypothetical protein
MLCYITMCWVLLLYYTILYRTVPYYTIQYDTILHYTILYYTILYCTIQYDTILYCTILYYTVPYCTVLIYPLFTPSIIGASVAWEFLQYVARGWVGCAWKLRFWYEFLRFYFTINFFVPTVISAAREKIKSWFRLQQNKT